MTFTVLIPARLASTRLPDKPLADIAGVPMVVRVAQRVQSGAPPGTRIVVAGDDERIITACELHGVEAILTSVDHASGSDRLAEASDLLALPDEAVVVNVQGDEPLIDPTLVASVAELLINSPQAVMGTAAHAIETVEEFVNPNVVKVVLDIRGRALYFSRAPIPWWRDGNVSGIAQLPQPRPLRHIGIYAYRAAFLRHFPKLTPAPLEQCEALEQLRVLWHGHGIEVHIAAAAPGPGVDTPQDLARVRAVFAAAG